MMPSLLVSTQSPVRRLFLCRVFAFFLLAAFGSALSSMQVPAVDANGNGILTSIQAEVRQGSGGVYVDIQPFISVETQNSAKVAAKEAARLAGVNLSNFDVFYKVVANTEVVDGPSGGHALGLLAYAEFTGKKVRTDLAATGSVEVDGSIGKVGGILEKVEAAQKAGVRLVLLPLGQAVQSGVDLTQYALARWGMQVVEVRNLNESVLLAFTPTGSVVNAPLHPEPALVLENVVSLQSAQVLLFKELAAGQVAGLQNTLESLKTDGVIAQVVRKAANRSSLLLEKGYYYSAANEAFLARIQADAYALSNLSKAELIQKVQALETELAAYRFAEPTDLNLEWSAGARLRWFWAKERLSELREKAEVSSRALPLLPDFAASKNWFLASKQLDEYARKIGGKPQPMQTWKAYASRQIQAANRSVGANPVDSEALFHYKVSGAAFDSGDYVAAAYDAAFAVAFNEARFAVSEAKDEQLPAVLPKKQREGFLKYQNEVWSQLYFAHALYSVALANASGDLLGVINAVKLQLLSEALSSTRREMISLIGQPFDPNDVSAPLGVQVTASVSPFGFPSWLAALAAVVLVALVLLALVLAFIRRPNQLSKLSKSERLDLLEQGLLEGRISEKTYEKLSFKYGDKLVFKPRKSKP